MMLTYLQPRCPEISLESSDACWTLCQTHLDFCLSFFFPTHTVTLHAQLLVSAAEKPAIFPNTEGEGGKSSHSQSTAAAFVANCKRSKMKESPRVWEVTCLTAQKREAVRVAVLRREARLQLNIDSDQIHMISGNFSPANKQKGAAGMFQKLFLEGSVRGASGSQPRSRAIWNSPCMNTTAAGTQVGSSRDFHSKPEA